MPCSPLPGGGFVCSRGRRRQPCSVPNCGRLSRFQCDAPVTRGGLSATCDVHLCEVHRKHVGKNRDLCPAHARQGELALEGKR